jgi:anaerobic selenocysteine-containing dehydrogenase
VELNPSDAGKLGVRDGDWVKIESRRGSFITKAMVTKMVSTGVVFAKFHYSEAPVNLLTNPVLDPISKIPELKVCAVNVTKHDAPGERAKASHSAAR